MIRIISPVVIEDDQFILDLEGFYADPSPNTSLAIHFYGQTLPVQLSEVPKDEYRFQGLSSQYFRCRIDLRERLASPPDEWRTRGASLVFEFDHGNETGRAEYELSAQWLAAMFVDQTGITPRVFPPAELQRRVVSVNGIFFSSFADISVRQIVDRIQSAGADMRSVGPVLDFGCGCCRIARTFKELYPSIDLWGCDIDGDDIDWCMKNIPAAAKFKTTEVLPPLPYEDNFFDAIYCVSIFTHLPEDWQFAWLSELRRILKPGGVFVTSLFSSPTIEWLSRLYPSSATLAEEVEANGFVYFGESRPGWAPWFGHRTKGMPEFYKNSFHSKRYVRERWGEFFEIQEIGHFDLNILQSAVVCRKPLDDGGKDFRHLGFLLREKGMRAGLAQAERYHSAHREMIDDLTSRLAVTDQALGEAQRLAYSRYDEVVALTRQIQETEAAFAEAARLAVERFERIQELEQQLKAHEDKRDGPA